MNNDKRVLGRQGAKELTPSEAGHVNGGITTRLSVCTIPRARGRRAAMVM
jgi:hypothetical protein